MATKIVTKNSSTASAVPTASDLVQGELAVNVADKRLFTEDNAGAIVELGTNPYNFTANHNGAAKLATTATGIDVTGTATMDYLTVGNAGSDYALKIKEGSGDEYYQLGVDSYGGLVFYNETTKVAEFTDASTFVTQGDITVNGTANMSGLTVSNSSANADLILTEGSTNTDARIRNSNGILEIDADLNNEFGNSSMVFAIDGVDKLKINNNGDISFYEDTGTTAKLQWSSSAESLTIGSGSSANPAAPFIVSNSETGGFSAKLTSSSFNSDGNWLGLGLGYTNNYMKAGILAEAKDGNARANLHFALDSQTGSGNVDLSDSKMTITYDGNVGIGTSSPSSELTIGADTPQIDLLKTSSADVLANIRAETDAGSGGKLVFQTKRNGDTALDRMTIDDDGNVGIGTTSPLSVASGYGALTVGGSTGGGVILSDTSSGHGQVYANSSQLTVDAFSSRNLTFQTNGSERMRIDSSGNLLVGTTDSATTRVSATTGGGHVFQPNDFVVFSRQSTTASQPVVVLNDTGVNGELLQFRKDGTTVGSIGSESGTNLTIGTGDTGIYFNAGADAVHPWNIGTNAARSGAIDLGRSADKFKDLHLSGTYHVNSGGTGKIQGTNDASYFPILGSGTSGSASIYLNGATRSGFAGHLQFAGTNTVFFNETLSQERMRIDSSGNLLVGQTSNAETGTGIGLVPDGTSHMYSASTDALMLGRGGSDGDILSFNKSGTTVGSIGTTSTFTYLVGQNSGIAVGGSTAAIIPVNGSGAFTDNSYDIGNSSYRFDDIYATNGTIQTSDRNEKQDIEELSDAEQRVAVAAKGLLRKFRWKDSVAEKGDEARVHFGIIAQDLQAAFAAEGLDAGDYAMFISTTWTDEETNEEKTRMGVRYSELLAFIIAAL